MAKKSLTARQRAIYEFIRKYTESHGYPPSVREIGNAVGLASPSTVHMHLKVLETHGYIARDPKKPRTIELLGPSNVRKPAEPMDIPEATYGTLNIPLVGRVAAGLPILAVENIEEVVPLPRSYVDNDSTFMLRVAGESMVNAGIMDGDLIVVKEQRGAQNGDIVVALIDDSATVKRFFKEESRVRLQPENDSMDPIYVDNPKILGKVTAVLRTY